MKSAELFPKDGGEIMAVVDRPNKEALLKALDIFVDTMRPFFVDCLELAPGASAKVSLERSLNDDQSKSFSRNLRFCSDLESAIEVSFLATIAECYWEDIFSARLGGDRRVLGKLRRVTEARNRASHPAHLRDLDDEFTQGILCLIASLLESIRARDEHEAVSRLREELGEPGRSVLGAENAAVKELKAKLKEAILGKLAAERRAQVLEKLTTDAHEQTRAAEIALAHAQSETGAAEAARQRAEDSAQESEYAREAAEKRAIAAEAGQFKVRKLKLATINTLQKWNRGLRRLKPQFSVYRNGMRLSEQTQ